MTFSQTRLDELTDRLGDHHAAQAHLLDPDFDPEIDDLEREFSELLCIRHD